MEREPGKLQRSCLWLALISLAVYVGAMTLFKISTNDIWIHLKTGEYVLRHGWVPLTDPYSFVAAGRPYIAHEWLAGVLFYVVYAAGGVTGLIFFKAAVLWAACALLVQTARRLRARMSVVLPAFAAALYVASARFLERPHIFSFLMTALYLWLFFRYRTGGRDRRWLWAILPAHVLWTNLHGGHIQGIALVAVLAAGEAFHFIRARFFGRGKEKALPARDIVFLALLVPGCVLAALINPYGYRLLVFPFQLAGSEVFMRTVFEWQPPYTPGFSGTTMFPAFLALVVAFLAAFFGAQRDRTRSGAGRESLGELNAVFIAGLALTAIALTVIRVQGPSGLWRPDILAFFLLFLFGLFGLFAIANVRSVDFIQAGLFALFFILSLKHNRAVADAALVIFVFLAANASAWLDRRTAAVAGAPPWRDRSGRSNVVLGSAFLIAAAVCTAVFGYPFDFSGSIREKGFGIASNMPVRAVDFIARNRLKGNAFVSYTFAGLLIHRMTPDVMVNMDSRNDVYGEELYLEYSEALRDPAAMRRYLQRYPVDFFLLSRDGLASAVYDDLISTGAWMPAYSDDQALVLVKRRTGPDGPP
ncbi:MAG: hypothetical protein NTU60_02495 [Candidatus Aminicenantes bacterium]|nr:hypothetical protein [Candidatus Aminicenantes bacterium]